MRPAPHVEWRGRMAGRWRRATGTQGGAQTLIAALCAEAPRWRREPRRRRAPCGPRTLDVVLPWTRPRHSWRLALDSTSDAPCPATCSMGTTRCRCRRAASCCSSRRSDRLWRPAAEQARASRRPCSTAWRVRPGSRRIGGTRPAVSTRSPIAQGRIAGRMGVPASSMADAREALEHFADERDRRALPCAFPAFRTRRSR